jgi:6-phosphogluconate dehydrogenase
MQLGIIGLGKMGIRIAEKLLADGHVVVGWNRTQTVVDEFRLVLQEKKLAERFLAADDIESLVKELNTPRVIWLQLPAGEATEAALKNVAQFATAGDIVIDGGNAFYKDTQRRFETFQGSGVAYLGIGVSGGVHAGENGYPLMVGGDEKAFETIKPILETLRKPHGGYHYFGTGGAGHFVKMVHNGIEYGMMQAISEGFGVLEKSPYDLNLVEVAKNWQQGTIIESNLVGWAKDALEKDPDLSKIDGVIDATGEAEWTVDQAKKEDVPVENIEQSLDFRRRSKVDKKVSSSFAARMVASIRHEFGGHKVTKK